MRWWIVAVASVGVTAAATIVLVERTQTTSTAVAATLPAVRPSLLTTVDTADNIGDLAFSPDGKTVADRLASGVVELRDALTGNVTARPDNRRWDEFRHR
jgi:hypothetical protein